MQERVIGVVQRVNGPVVYVKDAKDALMRELVWIGEERLVGEVLRLNKSQVVVQAYESTTGLRPGAKVLGSGSEMAIELGPGLLRSIYDGIQRPLAAIQKATGEFIGRGINVKPLDRAKLWSWKPAVKVGDTLTKGQIWGNVPETELITHKLLVPSNLHGEYEVKEIAEPGEYTLDQTLCTLISKKSGDVQELTMVTKWPIRVPRPAAERLELQKPLITGQRVIDTLFPVAKGGAVVVPGGFGTGKTMTQQAIAKWCDADLIVYIGCGERGNEMTDVLTEFPNLVDPRSGKSIMERTVLVANTSNMPVSAREASIYTGITIAEYYRDMGYDVALMADSTSRWAEALRELSGRLEEIPAEEGFPAYLPSRLAAFYERAGHMTTLSGQSGSVTVFGAVSPAGGDFSEPVTQQTKRFVRCFLALDKHLANARHYPAVSWIDSYSDYLPAMKNWWAESEHSDWGEARDKMMGILQQDTQLEQIIKLVGAESLPERQQLILEVVRIFKVGFLQQNAFDKVDRYSSPLKQYHMLSLIVMYYDKALEALHSGVQLAQIRALQITNDLIKMKNSVKDDEKGKFDKMEQDLQTSMKRLEALGEK